MNFTLTLYFLGFVGRFILAFIILSYFYSKDKNDIHLRKGFRTLCILGAIVFVLLIITIIIVFFVGGFGILNSLFDNVHHYSYSYNFPF
ncbi:MAG: hypothetical protein IJ339_02995 [Oscillospiraceae bacterium]|nr:hypothetical protein [Oscillospiraceae bacterium]